MAAKEPKRGEEDDYVLAHSDMSDDWTAVTYENGPSALWVVAKAPLSCDWIKAVMESSVFNEHKEGKTEKFEICGNPEYKKRVSSAAGLLFCFENDKWDSEMAEEVKDLSAAYEVKKVIIVLSEKTPDGRLPAPMNLQCNFPILNFSQRQVAWYENNLQTYDRKVEAMKRHMKGFGSWRVHTVGIFSRSAESDYEWLKILLESEYFRHTVKTVRPHCISNRGFQQFRTDVASCSFGIVYHTKNRGRINITDVTDALYDEELKFMSTELRNRQYKNVIIVVDDLPNGSEEEKSRILQSQPSIQEYAEDLFLFTSDEKKFLEPLVAMRNIIIGENK